MEKSVFALCSRKRRYAGCTKEGTVAPYSRIGGATNLLHPSPLRHPSYYTQFLSNDKNKFDSTVAILDNYFVPKVNIHFERHKFHQLTQTREETIDEFVCRLRQGAATYEFCDSVHERIRDQIISKCYPHDVRKKLLKKDAPTLDAVINTARVH